MSHETGLTLHHFFSETPFDLGGQPWEYGSPSYEDYIALCLNHGVRELWTADRDFSMFPKLKTRNPLEKNNGCRSSSARATVTP